MKIQYFETPEEIMKKARAKYGKHKKFVLARWPGEVTPRLIICNGTCGDPEDFDAL